MSGGKIIKKVLSPAGNALLIALIVLATLPAPLFAAHETSSQSFKHHRSGAVIVKFSSSLSSEEIQKINDKHNAAIARDIGNSRIKLVKGKSEESSEELLARYKDQAGVEYAELDYAVEALIVPNDPYFSNQWGLHKTCAPQGWNYEQGSPLVTVAIIDTGVDYTHPDLNGKVIKGYDFVNEDSDPMDGHGHGTHCAGIAAAVTNNGLGIAGMAPQVKILAIKVLSDSGWGYGSDIVSGIYYAVNNGAQVLSMSLGGDSYWQAVQDAVNYAYSKGCLIVASAGNSGSSDYRYPASCDNVISVGATDPNDNRATFSTYNNKVDVAAPGVSIVSTINGNRYAYYNGTSMAAPHVSGLCALMKSKYPGYANFQIEQQLFNSCDDLGGVGYDVYYGWGRINVARALGSTSAIGDFYEPDNTYGQATVISSGPSQYRNFHQTGDVDWVKFTAASDYRYYIQTSQLGSSNDTVLYLVASDGKTVLASDDNSGGGLAAKIEWDCLSSGTYYVRMQEKNSHGGSIGYEYTVSLMVARIADDYEPDNTYGQAKLISSGEFQWHNFHKTGDVDWVKFNAKAGYVYTIATTYNYLGVCADTVINLYAADGKTLLTSDDNGNGGLASKIVWESTTTTQYYVEVREKSGSGGASGYEYLFYFVEKKIADDYEPDNSPEQAKTISPGVYQSHNFHQPADVDWVKFTGGVDCIYTITTENLGACCDTIISLYAADGKTLLTSDDNGNGGLASKIVWECTQTAGYYLEVREKSGRGGAQDYQYLLKLGEKRIPDDYEPDNTVGEASWITAKAERQQHSLHRTGDVDWIKFVALGGENNYQIRTYDLGSRIDTYLELYDTDGKTLLASDDNGGPKQASKIVWDCPKTAVYYVKVADKNSDGAPSGYEYGLKIIGELVDPDPPVLTISGVVDASWYRSAVKPQIDVNDTDLDAAATTITLNGESFVSGTEVSAEGRHTFYIYACDLMGNESSRTVKFGIDQTPPVLTITGVVDGGVYKTPVAPVITFDDEHLDPPASVVTLNGKPYQSGTEICENRTYTLSVYAKDLAGNESTKLLCFTLSEVPPKVTRYYFPWYDCASPGFSGNWLLVGNPKSSTQTAQVAIYIGSTWMGTYNIPPGGKITPSYPGVMNGPVEVKVLNGVKVFCSQRVHYYSSFNEVMGVREEDL